jgi:uncharacterized protein (TIGR03437 family)
MRSFRFFLLPLVVLALRQPQYGQGLSFSLDQSALTFNVLQGGTPPPTQAVNLLSSGGALSFTASTSAPWLQVTPASGAMPATLQISIDPSGLQAGSYSGTVTITAAQATPTNRQVAVTLVVGAAASPKLLVSAPTQTFNFVQGAPAGSATLTVSNAGGGRLDFSIKASSSPNWLSVGASQGTATPSQPVTLVVTATPGILLAGVYKGTLTITSSTTGESLTISLTMNVTAAQRKILLSQTGLTFVGISASSQPLPQTFGILNLGTQPLDWNVRAVTPTGGPISWLTVSPGSGTVQRPYLDVSLITVTVDPKGLLPGDYYGQIQVTAAGADNSPQTVTVLFTVRPTGSSLPPELRPTGLIFTGQSGSTPASQSVTISIPGQTALTYNSSRVTLDGQNWFTHTPVSGTIQPGQPAQFSVQPSFSSLSPGIYSGVITVQFSDNRVGTVKLLSVVAPAGTTSVANSGAALAGFDPAGTCVPSQIRIQLTTLQSGFGAALGQPVPLEVQVVDDCGVPVTNDRSAAVSATFSTGDSGISLVHTASGKWGRTWQPRASASRMAITFTAFVAYSNGKILANQLDVACAISTGATVPLVAEAGVVSSASYLPNSPVAPGALISVFGSKLADTTESTTGAPLKSVLGDTQVQLGGTPLPLLYASDGQVNAQVPYDVAVNTELQLLVKRGDALSVPLSVTVAAAQPAIFTVDQSGSGQGVIVDGVTNLLNGVANPARAGDTVVIYCTGLGNVTPPVAAGQASTGPASTNSPVTVTMDGKPAQVNYAGLTPGFPGLYQINAVVPAGITPGNSVAVVASLANASSSPVTFVVR